MNKTVRLSKTATLEEYFSWLLDTAESNRTYDELLKIMYEKPFKSYVANDENRMEEGRNLRERFCDELGIEYVPDYFPYTVSFLEVVLALAFRAEAIMADQDVSMPASCWFWTMMHNVGLDQFTDEYFRADIYRGRDGKRVASLSGSTDEVDDILEQIIERTYRRNGKGSLFPLENPKKDQRKVELWYQLNLYLTEKYWENLTD